MVRGGAGKPVEDTARGRLAQWLNEIIKEESLPFEGVDVQWPIPLDGKQLYADLVLWKKWQKKAACVIEYKPPLGWTPYTHDLVDDAERKAMKISPQSPYFGTWNTNELVVFKTFDPEAEGLVDRRRGTYSIGKVRALKELWRPETEVSVKDSLRSFLLDFDSIYRRKSKLPRLTPDDFFINAMRSAIEATYYPIAEIVRKAFLSRRGFRKKLTKWFLEQGWSPPREQEDFDKTARQYSYLLIDKVLFYHLLRSAGHDLPALTLPKALTGGERFKHKLQEFFDTALAVTGDYEAVFSVDFVEHLPLPPEIVPSLVSFVNGFGRYDVSKLNYADIGKIYDTLIPSLERHILGQYFTRDDVIDLINTFCIRGKDDIISDFGCGVGTFLVRAYALKRRLEPGKSHSEILKDLYGVDISKFPAHLAVINLVIRELSADDNYPQIANIDFFDLSPGGPLPVGLPSARRSGNLPQHSRMIEFPRLDCVVGNPPYTRHQEMDDQTYEGYKLDVLKKLNEEWESKYNLGKMASIYAHFMVHALRFLDEEGRFGYVTSNSWLDVNYGKALQNLFLSETKIVAILESSVEKWFEDAEINTAITILEKCRSKKKRITNIVRFVRLKRPLSEIVGPADKKRFDRVQKLVNQINSIKTPYSDDDMRVIPVSQKELIDESFDKETGDVIGGKWGKYLRAPDIYFEKIANHPELMPLSEMAKVDLGITTGRNPFFYLDEDMVDTWGIEDEYLVPLIKSPREFSRYVKGEEDLENWVLVVRRTKGQLKGTKVLRYIVHGETEGIPDRPFFRAKPRTKWFAVEPIHAKLVSPYQVNKRHFVASVPSHVAVDKQLVCISPNKKVDSLVLGAYLNSTIAILFKELLGRTSFGLGSLQTSVTDIQRIPCIDVRKLPADSKKKLRSLMKKMYTEPIMSVFGELGASEPEDFKISKVSQTRRKLDNIIFSHLGLDDLDAEEVYRSVIELVQNRMLRSKSLVSSGKTKRPDLDLIARQIVDELDSSLLRSFPEEFLPQRVSTEKIVVPQGPGTIGSDLQGIYFELNEQRTYCKNKVDAEYLKYSALHGAREVSMPKDSKVVEDVVRNYRPVYKKLRSEIQDLLSLYSGVKSLLPHLERLVLNLLASRQVDQ